MNNLRKLSKLSHGFEWTYLFCTEDKFGLPMFNFYVNGSHNFAHTLRFYSAGTELAKRSNVVISEAQAALFDYFHGDRGLQLMDAENMSKNTPNFLDSLTKSVGLDGTEVKRSLTRYLRYHPINEFEPFFESIGLKPCEYLPFLPQNQMFLNEDELLLENYSVLCNNGFNRNWIGKVYKEATEIFRYDFGLLSSKIQFFRNSGLAFTIVAKFIASTPRLLVENIDQEFLEVISKLERAVTEYERLEECISVKVSYDWKCMLKVMHLFSKLCLKEEQIGQIYAQHPQLLLEGSGRITFLLFGFLLKFGYTLADVQNLFLQFPKVSAVKFVNNLYSWNEFLMEINMGADGIGSLVRSHPTLLGSCEPKRTQSLMAVLNVSKTKIREMLVNDPHVLEKWARGVRVGRLQGETRVLKTRMLKTEFLLSLGYVDKSKEMEKTLKALRGRGAELHERFDCLTNIGLSREEAARMISRSPRILNQSKDVLKTKIEFLVKDLDLSVSELATYPKILAYTIPRIKLRYSFYKWLRDKGSVQSKLALSTLMSFSEEGFVKTYVSPHIGGLAVWKKLKKEIEAE